MPAIFDNVRDGLILLRYPEEEVVLFNRAASDTCGIAVAEVLGGTLNDIIPDPKVAETAKRCSELAVGEWPGHYQDVMPTKIDGPDGTTRDVELHFCRVDDPETGKPLVLLVMRPDDEAELEALAAMAKKARHHVSELELRLRKRREEAVTHAANLSKSARTTASGPPPKTNRRPPRAAGRVGSREGE
jgi:PAS domain S-box-containing protein